MGSFGFPTSPGRLGIQLVVKDEDFQVPCCESRVPGIGPVRVGVGRRPGADHGQNKRSLRLVPCSDEFEIQRIYVYIFQRRQRGIKTCGFRLLKVSNLLGICT